MAGFDVGGYGLRVSSKYSPPTHVLADFALALPSRGSLDGWSEEWLEDVAVTQRPWLIARLDEAASEVRALRRRLEAL